MMLVSRRHFLAMALSLPVVASAAVNAPSQAGSTDLVETMLTRAHVPRHSNELWVLVDDQDATLSVFRGNALVDRFAPISLGRAGLRRSGFGVIMSLLRVSFVSIDLTMKANGRPL